jgi:hypothetical protein
MIVRKTSPLLSKIVGIGIDETAETAETDETVARGCYALKNGAT